MLDMFEGEGAKRAPGDLNFGKRFLPENKAEADELAMKACVGSRNFGRSRFITFVLVRLRNQPCHFTGTKVIIFPTVCMIYIQLTSMWGFLQVFL